MEELEEQLRVAHCEIENLKARLEAEKTQAEDKVFNLTEQLIGAEDVVCKRERRIKELEGERVKFEVGKKALAAAMKAAREEGKRFMVEKMKLEEQYCELQERMQQEV